MRDDEDSGADANRRTQGQTREHRTRIRGTREHGARAAANRGTHRAGQAQPAEVARLDQIVA